MLVEVREIQVQLQRAPQPQLCFLRITRAHQQVQGGAMSVQQISGNVRADVYGRAGQKYRHVAPLVPVFTVSLFAGASGKLRGGFASRGLPSSMGYVAGRT